MYIGSEHIHHLFPAKCSQRCENRANLPPNEAFVVSDAEEPSEGAGRVGPRVKVPGGVSGGTGWLGSHG